MLRAYKKCFGKIPYYLVTPDVREAHLIFERYSFLPKVYLTNGPNRRITLLCIANTLLCIPNTLFLEYTFVYSEYTFVCSKYPTIVITVVELRSERDDCCCHIGRLLLLLRHWGLIVKPNLRYNARQATVAAIVVAHIKQKPEHLGVGDKL